MACGECVEWNPTFQDSGHLYSNTLLPQHTRAHTHYTLHCTHDKPLMHHMQ